MPAPIIPDAPPPPLRSQDSGLFSAKAETFVEWLADLPASLNEFVDWLNSYSPPSSRELWNPNFTDDGEVRIYADVAMTITQLATSGSGTVSYEKSTSGSPASFNATTSPITLQAGAWLKVIGSDVEALFAVALKRTA